MNKISLEEVEEKKAKQIKHQNMMRERYWIEKYFSLKIDSLGEFLKKH